MQGQTWDLNGPDVDYVIALHRLPDDGPETWTVTCAGCQTLMGMNAHGLAVGTTNLKTRGARRAGMRTKQTPCPFELPSFSSLFSIVCRCISQADGQGSRAKGVF
ncbi:hypothetical protein SOQ14_09185 [Erythrobacter sp. T5W1-R]|uniref:hypothetical protein n=1 Tax=Erythrobacter sp. T5W1-R TaxID=3101752 RepID=UPI002AFE24CE|nr:hypothetical protein [Erythrobacter sp. T5W1-R]MEA1619090.1 hypothetical protein [Erythrobacter sp. T5W1-R]